MTSQQITNLLVNIKKIIEDDLKDWNPKDSNSNNYLAYGPTHKDAVKNIEELLNYFNSDVKFEKELAKAYNEDWPDFVDGDMI